MIHDFMYAQAFALRDYFAALPAECRDEIQRLNSAIWARVQATKDEALVVEAALNDPAHKAFMARVLTKPKRTRKPKKTATVLELVPKRKMTAAEVRAWQMDNREAA